MIARRLALGLIILCGIPGNGRAEQPPVPPRPIDALTGGSTEAYIAKAQSYLSEHANGQNTPWVLHDLLIVADVMQNQALGDDVRLSLLMDFPEHPVTGHMLGVFAEDAKAQNAQLCRKFRAGMERSFERPERDFVNPFPQKYCVALNAVFDRLGAESLNSPKMALYGFAASREAQESNLRTRCRKVLKENPDQEAKRIYRLLDNNIDSVETLSELHRQKVLYTPALERFYLSRLTAEERAQPVVVKIQIENLLAANNFRDAAAAIEKSGALQELPQTQFWLAWCHAALGQRDKCVSVADASTKNSPDDEWTKRAQELSQVVTDVSVNLERHSQGILKMLVQARSHQDADAFGAVLTYEKSESQKYQFSIAVCESKGIISAELMDNQRLLAGYRASQGRHRWYLNGDATIHDVPGNPFFPELQFAIQRDERGKKRHNVSFNTGPAGVMSGSLIKLFGSRSFSTIPGLCEMLEHFPEVGAFPAAPEAGAQGITYRWIIPLIDQPRFTKIEIQVSPKNELLKVSVDEKLYLDNIQIGKMNEITRPTWPDLEVVEANEPGAMLRELMTILTWVGKMQKEYTAQSNGTVPEFQ